MLSVFLTASVQMLKLLVYILFGYLMCRRGFLNDDMVKGIMAMILNFFIPVMVFNSLQMDYSQTLLVQGLIISLLYVLSCALAYFLAVSIGKRTMSSLPDGAAADWKFDSIFSNAGFVGLPVVAALFNSEEAMFYGCCVIVVLNIFFGSVGENMYRVFGGNDASPLSFKKLIRSPVPIAMVLGLLCFFLRIRVPAILSECFSTITSIIGPLIMFSLGALMTKGRLRETFSHPSYYVLIVIKMLIAPLTVWAFGHLLTSNAVTLTVAMIMCAMPGPAAAAPLALQHGNPLWASRYVIVSTLISVVTLPILYALATIW